MTSPGQEQRDRSLEDVERTLKVLVASHLNLDIDPQQIDAHEEHFLTARGFNSIDALELLITVEKEFGIQIDDEDLDASLLRTLNVLSQYIVTSLQERHTQ